MSTPPSSGTVIVSPHENDPVLSVTVRKLVGAFTLDITFSATHRMLALVGASGSGKTLTLRAIAGLLTPDAGRIVLGSRVLFDSAASLNLPARARHVGYVFQQYALFPHYTVAQNIGYGLHGSSNEERRARVQDMLELVGLPAFADRMPRTLSGGEQQRVAVARALAPRPAALLLDEPLSAVDAPLRVRLGEQLRYIGEQLSIPMVLVTHDMNEAQRIAGHIVHVDKGRGVGAEATTSTPQPATP
jgi:ABC-type sulfate/molybdate transport systems ATPase subunit